MNTGDVLLEASALSFRYRAVESPALEQVGLKLKRGLGLGLLGLNGSGKSTLIRLLAGTTPLQRGSILRPSGPVTVALVPQEEAFYPQLSCGENLQLFAGLLGLDPAAISRRVEGAIEATMLGEFFGRLAQHCSGGVRRRLNLAIALLQQPDVLLMDEPTVGVDPQSRAFLFERVRELVAGGTAVLYATHYMEEVEQVCSWAVVIDHGHVLVEGPVHALLAGDDRCGPFPDMQSMFMHHIHHSLSD